MKYTNKSYQNFLPIENESNTYLTIFNKIHWAFPVFTFIMDTLTKSLEMYGPRWPKRDIKEKPKFRIILKVNFALGVGTLAS